ncbi:rifin [Plasmodium falciparum IGH-CR14]|uniref:Rifin n=1 Tax=Plasmodium falciparum IGH-CR14 TaxID=580059 RepID=A0A0L1I8J5_PLAFA|nr:rifin [Plasmodium falciparum IGH-CR14]
MKVHYFNILLFALPLNILVGSPKKNPSITQKRPTTRLLCECELYSPANYNNDPQMKSVIDNFNKQTQQRLHEYDERMKTTRQECKEQCDKEIQKIILKDKLEKELMEKFATLHTDIQSDAIPTCVCEKSLEDKMEKGCLKCAQNLGGIVAPSSGVLAGIAEGALYAWKPTALKVAIASALEEGATKIAAAGIEAGKKVVFGGLDALNIAELKIAPWETYFAEGYSINVKELATVMFNQRNAVCYLGSSLGEDTCKRISISIGTMLPNGKRAAPGTSPIEAVLNGIVKGTKGAADAAAKSARETVTTGITEKETGVINTLFLSKQTAIIASIIAIVVIILIMVIIYLILRYRRKNKMKKKLQYIKLLEE